MKAIVQERFGPPDILRLADTDRPEVGANQVLVRVRAAALNPYDWHMMRGDPFMARLTGAVGLTRPKSRVAGIDAAGQVEAVGADVRGLQPGDEVLGFCPGSFAEYAVTTADLLVPKPATLTFEQAAAVPMAAVTALRGIRTVGQVQAGQRVLVNGAAAWVWARSPYRSLRPCPRRSPGCAAPATSSWCARWVPRTSSTTPGRTSPTGAGATT